jgi:hypothetical protein
MKDSEKKGFCSIDVEVSMRGSAAVGSKLQCEV